MRTEKGYVNDIIKNFIEIEFVIPDGFRIVKETLKRVGLVDPINKIIYPQCYIFHKKEIYYIIHRKELLLLNNIPAEIEKEDINIRNKIANLLVKFKLISIVNMPNDSYDKEDDSSYVNFTFLKKDDMKNFKIDNDYNIFKGG